MWMPQEAFVCGAAATFAAIDVEAALAETSTGFSGSAFPFPGDSKRPQPTDKIFMICLQCIRHRHRCYRPDSRPGAERTSRDIVCHHRPRRKDRAFPNSQRLARRADYSTTRHNCRILPDHDPAAFPDAPRMRDDGGAQSDRRTIVYLHAIGILILEIHVVPDEDFALYLHPAQSMQKWSQAGRAGQNPGHQMEYSVEYPSRK
jgi:hypothetical protein